MPPDLIVTCNTEWLIHPPGKVWCESLRLTIGPRSGLAAATSVLCTNSRPQKAREMAPSDSSHCRLHSKSLLQNSSRSAVLPRVPSPDGAGTWMHEPYPF